MESTSSIAHPSGRKSQAVDWLGGGMPGVSGEEKLRGPPMSGRFAKEPGVVPWAWLDGFRAPFTGIAHSRSSIEIEGSDSLWIIS